MLEPCLNDTLRTVLAVAGRPWGPTTGTLIGAPDLGRAWPPAGVHAAAAKLPGDHEIQAKTRVHKRAMGARWRRRQHSFLPSIATTVWLFPCS